jgi:hypothetical protein
VHCVSTDHFGNHSIESISHFSPCPVLLVRVCIMYINPSFLKSLNYINKEAQSWASLTWLNFVYQVNQSFLKSINWSNKSPESWSSFAGRCVLYDPGSAKQDVQSGILSQSMKLVRQGKITSPKRSPPPPQEFVITESIIPDTA